MSGEYKAAMLMGAAKMKLLLLYSAGADLVGDGGLLFYKFFFLFILFCCFTFVSIQSRSN